MKLRNSPIRKTLLGLCLLAPYGVAQDAPPAKPAADVPTKVAPAKTEQPQARIAEITVSIDGTEDPAASNPFGKTKLNYHGFLKFVEDAAADPKLDAILLTPKTYGVGWARLLEVRTALSKLRKSGKKVFVYMESMQSADLVIASVADRISIPESGSVFLPGIATESLYMREMLAKVHVKFDVVHIGEYKTAGESMVRDTMSDALKEALNPILDELYSGLVDSISEGRGLSKDAVKAAIDKGIMSAREAKKMGLIDRIEYRDEFKAGIRAHFPGKKLKWADDYRKKNKNAIDPNNPMAALSVIFSQMMGSEREPKLNGPKVAIIYCTGAITSGSSQYDWQGSIASMGSETIVKAIDKARKDKSIKAIVLRINSPGGSGLASDMMWRAIERAKAEKPVIASMGDVAASGGYYIAMNSHRIFAEPQTITGSIGVVGMMPNLDGLYRWVGITPQRLSRGKRAEALGTSKGLDEDSRVMLRDYMKAFYGDFVAKVAAGRGMTPAEVEPLARGRIWSGRAALRNGLVDQMGGLRDAVAHARAKAAIDANLVEGEGFHVVEYPRRGGPFDALQKMLGVYVKQLGIDRSVLQHMPALRRALTWVASVQAVAKDRVCAFAPELAGLTAVHER